MKVFSKTHSIAASADSAVERAKGTDGKPLSKTLVVQHPAGTVLDLPDDSANELIARGFAVEYKEDEHKAVDGVVPVARVQAVAQTLPEGATQPTVVRQDETLNDGQPPGNVAAGPNGPVILRDTKNDALVEKEKEAAAAANAARAGLPAGTGATAAPGTTTVAP